MWLDFYVLTASLQTEEINVETDSEIF